MSVKRHERTFWVMQIVYMLMVEITLCSIICQYSLNRTLKMSTLYLVGKLYLNKLLKIHRLGESLFLCYKRYIIKKLFLSWRSERITGENIRAQTNLLRQLAFCNLQSSLIDLFSSSTNILQTYFLDNQLFLYDFLIYFISEKKSALFF